MLHNPRKLNLSENVSCQVLILQLVIYCILMGDSGKTFNYLKFPVKIRHLMLAKLFLLLDESHTESVISAKLSILKFFISFPMLLLFFLLVLLLVLWCNLCKKWPKEQRTVLHNIPQHVCYSNKHAC